MSPETRARLLVADDPVEVESGRENDPLAWPRARATATLLGELLGHPLKLDENVQDASFFTEMVLEEPAERGVVCYRFAVRLSNFGRLATVWETCSPERAFPRELKAEAELILTRGGYRTVPADELMGAPYDGVNERLREYTKSHRFTWWDRFFDYL